MGNNESQETFKVQAYQLLWYKHVPDSSNEDGTTSNYDDTGQVL